MATRAIVTAGSAVTELDEVRHMEVQALGGGDLALPAMHWHLSMQNIFKGEMGALIANKLSRAGVETTLLIRRESVSKLTTDPAVRVVPFRTFGELESELWANLEWTAPDLVVMAAAPPDYAPSKVEGKLQSSDDELLVRFRPTPKLLDGIRPRVGPNCCIVGFKLLVSVTDEELSFVARRQMARADTDWCVGNDLSRVDFRARTHPVLLVRRDGSRSSFTGVKGDVVSSFINQILKQDRKDSHSR